MHNGYSWDDLRFLLAVARAGTLSGAARSLGVKHTTVSRRIRGLEERVGVRLFERLSSGWATTEAGEDMLASARRVEEEMAAVDRRVLGQDARLSGTVRVAITDIMAVAFMAEFADFSQRNPGIELELIAGYHPSNLTEREADVAVRATAAPPEHLVGRRVSGLTAAAFGSRAYLARHPLHATPLADHVWLGFDPSLEHLPPARWMREQLPLARIAGRTNSGLVMQEAIRAGLGVGHLFTFMGDADPELERVTEPEGYGFGLWVLTHPDLRRTARIRRFTEFLADACAEKRAAFEAR
jgi:DNA-binding transcriptional LysR family regulator